MGVESIISSQTKKTLLLVSLSAIACGFLQSDWIFWIPGALFGILFALANFRKIMPAILYAVLSSGTYIGAVTIFFKLAGSDLSNYLAGGFVAGGFGALVLALFTKLMSKSSLSALTESRTIILGGLTGILFVHIFLSGISGSIGGNFDRSWAGIPGAFAVWQIPVGWSLTASIQRNSYSAPGLSTNASD